MLILSFKCICVCWMKWYGVHFAQNLFKVFLSTATRMMTTTYISAREKVYVTIGWTTPRFDPEWYKLTGSCTLRCAHEPYTNRVYFAYPYNNTPSVNVTALKPGSNCDFNLLAMYNYASTDKGLHIVTSTKDSCEDIRHVLSDIWSDYCISFFFFYYALLAYVNLCSQKYRSLCYLNISLYILAFLNFRSNLQIVQTVAKLHSWCLYKPYHDASRTWKLSHTPPYWWCSIVFRCSLTKFGILCSYFCSHIID